MSSNQRYSRQTRLDKIGEQGQKRLAESSVLVVGAGGLGCPVLMSLCEAGIGKIGVVDFDHVEVSNLSRQWLFTEKDIGQPKVFAAFRELNARNSKVDVLPFYNRLTDKNAAEFISSFDVVVDATDNFDIRYLLNDVCFRLKKPFVFGAVYKYEGQVGVFNASNELINLRDVYPFMPDPALMPSCDSTGILVTSTTIIGNIQAQEVIHLVVGNSNLNGSMLTVDLERFESRVVKIVPNPQNPLRIKEGNVSFNENKSHFCQSTNTISNHMVQEISVHDLKALMNSNEPFWLIDVREVEEFEICSIGGELIPLSQIGERWSEIPSTEKVVVFCRSGVRSANVIRFLQEQHGYNNLWNLEGGILAWIDKIDPELPIY
ncbi:MAG: ThiF family adenylyltransferase [Flavobacteriales bacterium]